MPDVASSGTPFEGTTATLSVAAPSDVDAGDIIVIPAFLLDAVTIGEMPAGWDYAPDQPVAIVGGGAHSQVVLWHRAAGPEAGPYEFPLTGSTYAAAQAHRVIEAKSTGSPWDVADFATDTVNAADTPPVAITTSADGSLGWFVATNWAGGPWTPPNTWTERTDFATGLVTAASKALPTAGGTGEVVATTAAPDKRTAWLSAILPEPAEEPPPSGEGEPLNLAHVMERLATRAKTIAGLRTYGWPTDHPAVPAGIVGYPDEIAFGATYRRGMDTMTIPFWIAVGKVSDRASRDLIGPYADGSGAASVKAALEAAAEGEGEPVFNTLEVTRAAFDIYTSNSIEYLAVRFDCAISGRGA